MDRAVLRFLVLLLLFFAAGTSLCEAQSHPRTGGNSNRNTFFYKLFHKDAKVKEPRGVTKKKREQEKKEAKIRKDYEKYVADSRKRAYDIQTPDVQARMIQNEKDIKKREKSKKKKNSNSTRKAAQKYK